MKEIRYGIPDKPDLGDTLLLTPVFKNNPGTMEFNRTARGAQISELFRGLCDIRFVDKVLPESEYFTRYGNITKKQPLNHACKNYCSIFGVETNDFIPKIILTEDEKQFAREFTKDLRNPITITPITGIFPNDPQKTATWMLSQEKWNELTAELSKKHDILYFSKSGTDFKINNTIELFGMDVRKMCALFNICGRNIGIENGLLHAAIASGATTYNLIQGYSWGYNIYAPNYIYTPDMWQNEPKRAFYFLLNDYKKILEHF